MDTEKDLKESAKQALTIPVVTCRKFWVRYKYKRLMARLMKSYWHTCNEMAFLQDKAPRRLRLKWAFQQRRIKLYKRYLSIYGR